MATKYVGGLKGLQCNKLIYFHMQLLLLLS